MLDFNEWDDEDYEREIGYDDEYEDDDWDPDMDEDDLEPFMGGDEKWYDEDDDEDWDDD
jgi:hypothetical protein